MPAPAIVALKEHQAQSLRGGVAGESWVFVSKTGGFVQATSLKRTRQRILERAGLPQIRLHDLSHSQATLLLLAGINPKVDQERLGHSRIATTMDTYSHVMPSMQRQAADTIGAMLPVGA